MKKNKKSPKARKAAAKRGQKRSNRLKATQKNKGQKNQVRIATKRNQEKKFIEHMSRLMGEINPMNPAAQAE